MSELRDKVILITGATSGGGKNAEGRNQTGRRTNRQGCRDAFLCSSAAQMINGHDIALDGGLLAKR
jgi:NAD(P)-dependent dehydrogenase (short-subunit alcohol dehydrogenase family)